MGSSLDVVSGERWVEKGEVVEVESDNDLHWNGCFLEGDVGAAVEVGAAGADGFDEFLGTNDPADTPAYTLSVCGVCRDGAVLPGSLKRLVKPSMIKTSKTSSVSNAPPFRDGLPYRPHRHPQCCQQLKRLSHRSLTCSCNLEDIRVDWVPSGCVARLLTTIELVHLRYIISNLTMSKHVILGVA